MPSEIPRARGILKAALYVGDIDLVHDMIREALPLMKRSQLNADRGARLQRVKMTREIVEMVKEEVRLSEGVPFETIGRRFGIAGGRVSEIMNGLRDTPDGSLKKENGK